LPTSVIHPSYGLPSNLFQSDLPTKIMYAVYCPTMRVKFPTNLIFRDLNVLNTIW